MAVSINISMDQVDLMSRISNARRHNTSYILSANEQADAQVCARASLIKVTDGEAFLTVSGGKMMSDIGGFFVSL